MGAGALQKGASALYTVAGDPYLWAQALSRRAPAIPIYGRRGSPEGRQRSLYGRRRSLFMGAGALSTGAGDPYLWAPGLSRRAPALSIRSPAIPIYGRRRSLDGRRRSLFMGAGALQKGASALYTIAGDPYLWAQALSRRAPAIPIYGRRGSPEGRQRSLYDRRRSLFMGA